MKKLIPFLVIVLTISLQSSAQKKQNRPAASAQIALTPEKWSFKEGKVEFADYKGKRSMKLSPQSGQVVLKDLVFKDGTIEYDVDPDSKEFASSIYFHRKDEKEQEIVYLRVSRIDNPFANEGIQYCPYFNGVNMWDMYPQYQAPAPAKSGEWNHIKLIISGKQLHVFVNSKLVLEVPKLEGRETEGSISFEGAGYISNVEIKPNETEGLSPLEGADLTRHQANYIRQWSVTQPGFLPAATEPTTLMYMPQNEAFADKIDAERDGFVNLTRRFGGDPKRRVVWLKSTITAKEAMKTNLQLGFSDEIWIYLNDRMTYADKNLFQQNMRKYPDGRLSVQNGSVLLNLRQGKNDLLIAVANDFYGWGIIARLENIESITKMEAYEAPPKIAIENIEQYTGIYANKDGSVKLSFTQKNGELIAQAGNQDPLPTTYAGNHVFTIERFGVELSFNPAQKKVILKENGNETEFTRQ